MLKLLKYIYCLYEIHSKLEVLESSKSILSQFRKNFMASPYQLCTNITNIRKKIACKEKPNNTHLVSLLILYYYIMSM